MSCVDLCARIGAHDLELHFALCLWAAAPGVPVGARSLVRAAQRRSDLEENADRIEKLRATVDDWCAIAAVDEFGDWPELRALCASCVDRGGTFADLVASGRIERVRDQAWVLPEARVTRTGRSVAIGSAVPSGRQDHTYVPALSIWDCAPAVQWQRQSPSAHLSGGAAVLATRSSFSGYWHWVFEGLLPAVRLDEIGLLAQVDRLIICVEQEGKPFVRDSLRRLGVDSMVVSEMADPFDLAIDQLVLPRRRPGAGGIHDATYAAEDRYFWTRHDIPLLRRRLGLERRAARPGPRLLISRRDATKRRVTNERELEAALARHGFETLVPGELTFDEQVEAFASAQVVVGPHGAGMTNLVFAAPRTGVLELQLAGESRRLYSRVSRMIGLPYADLECVPDPASPVDMLVDVDRAAKLAAFLVLVTGS